MDKPIKELLKRPLLSQEDAEIKARDFTKNFSCPKRDVNWKELSDEPRFNLSEVIERHGPQFYLCVLFELISELEKEYRLETDAWLGIYKVIRFNEGTVADLDELKQNLELWEAEESANLIAEAVSIGYKEAGMTDHQRLGALLNFGSKAFNGKDSYEVHEEARTESKKKLERLDQLRDALRSRDGNKSAAARDLGLSRTQLYRTISDAGDFL